MSDLKRPRRSRWTVLTKTSPSGKTMFCCSFCGRESVTPDKVCKAGCENREPSPPYESSAEQRVIAMDYGHDSFAWMHAACGSLPPTARVTLAKTTEPNAGDILRVFDQSTGESFDAVLLSPALIKGEYHATCLRLDRFEAELERRLSAFMPRAEWQYFGEDFETAQIQGTPFEVCYSVDFGVRTSAMAVYGYPGWGQDDNEARVEFLIDEAPAGSRSENRVAAVRVLARGLLLWFGV